MTRPSATTARDRIAAGLMVVAALGAVYAFASSIPEVGAAGPQTQQVAAWRMVSYLMFAGVFALLALWPRRYPLLWELTIANKALLTVVEAVLIAHNAVNATSSALFDGALTIVLLAAYALSRGYASWKAPRSP